MEVVTGARTVWEKHAFGRHVFLNQRSSTEEKWLKLEPERTTFCSGAQHFANLCRH